MPVRTAFDRRTARLCDDLPRVSSRVGFYV